MLTFENPPSIRIVFSLGSLINVMFLLPASRKFTSRKPRFGFLKLVKAHVKRNPLATTSDTRKVRKAISPRGTIKNSTNGTATRFAGIVTIETVPKVFMMKGKVANDAATVVFTLVKSLVFHVFNLKG